MVIIVRLFSYVIILYIYFILFVVQYFFLICLYSFECTFKIVDLGVTYKGWACVHRTHGFVECASEEVGRTMMLTVGVYSHVIVGLTTMAMAHELAVRRR